MTGLQISEAWIGFRRHWWAWKTWLHTAHCIHIIPYQYNISINNNIVYIVYSLSSITFQLKWDMWKKDVVQCVSVSVYSQVMHYSSLKSECRYQPLSILSKGFPANTIRFWRRTLYFHVIQQVAHAVFHKHAFSFSVQSPVFGTCPAIFVALLCLSPLFRFLSLIASG